MINPDFISDIANWDTNFNNSAWLDNDGHLEQGCLRFGRNSNNNASVFTFSDPITVILNNSFIFGSSSKIPSDSTSPYTFIHIIWYDSNNFMLAESDFFYSWHYPDPPPRDQWFELMGHSKAPAETSYAEIYLWIQLGSDGSMDETYSLWDDVWMLQDTLFYGGFE